MVISAILGATKTTPPGVTSTETGSDRHLESSKERLMSNRILFPPISQPVSKYPYVNSIPGDLAERFVRDWLSTEGNDQEDNVEFLKPIVYSWMLCEHANTANFRHSWSIDADSGIEELAFYVAGWTGRAECELLERWHELGITSGEVQLRYIARTFINLVWRAVTQLIEDGKVDLHLELGWPALRLTDWTAEDESIYLQDSDRPRAEQMRLRREALRVMPYPEYLKSDEWQFRREAHLEAAGERCQLCNSDQHPLHVHHRTYANRGRERFYDLVVLCPPCHKAFHESGRKVR